MRKRNPFEADVYKPSLQEIGLTMENRQRNVSRETDEALRSVKALLRKARKDAFVAGYNQGLGRCGNVSESLIEQYLQKFDAND